MTASETDKALRRYDRLAPVYDLMEGVAEHRVMREWRRRLWSLVEGTRILEVGVGTGRNLPFYPSDSDVVAIDLSPAMLARAQRSAESCGRGDTATSSSTCSRIGHSSDPRCGPPISWWSA